MKKYFAVLELNNDTLKPITVTGERCDTFLGAQQWIRRNKNNLYATRKRFDFDKEGKIYLAENRTDKKPIEEHQLYNAKITIFCDDQNGAEPLPIDEMQYI